MAKAKTLKSRFTKQATRIVSSGKTNKAGTALSQKEIARRALAQAKRHRASAKTKKATKNANLRAFASVPSLSGTAASANLKKGAKKSIGKNVRQARTRAGVNISTGAKQSALKTGRKAIKTSVRRGSASAKQGSKSLAQLAALDPTSRRGMVGRAGTRAADKNSGGFKRQQGKDLSATLKGIRKSAKKAKGKPRATASTTARRRNA